MSDLAHRGRKYYLDLMNTADKQIADVPNQPPSRRLENNRQGIGQEYECEKQPDERPECRGQDPREGEGECVSERCEEDCGDLRMA